MDINKVLREFDALPGGEEAWKAHEFLKENIALAASEGDHSSELTLINEMLGYLRYTCRYDEIDTYADMAVSLCEKEGLKGGIPYATTLLNIATAKRAAGGYEEAGRLYGEVEALYDKLIDKKDYLYAALYNNMSLLHQATGDHAKSADCLEKALLIVKDIDERRVEQAITLTNLGQAYIRLSRFDDAAARLDEAESIFEELGGDEFHYPGCLNALGALKSIEGDHAESAAYYGKALVLLERYVGRDNPTYTEVKESMEAEKAEAVRLGQETTPAGNATKKNFVKGMDLSRKFYEEFGRDMIHEKFPEYEDDICVGLVGRGSQCYGYDDELSGDHDFGPDFCMWVDDETYDKIGSKLQKAYEDLPTEFMGYTRVKILPPDGRRVGVIRTKEFYSRILEISESFLTDFLNGTIDETVYYAAVKEENLSQCVNGEIFKGSKGDFERIREKIAYYPDKIWRRRIAEELHYSAQMGQYNYIRMLKRGEKVASEIALAGYMEHTMKLVYLINRVYAPYYKWLHRGMADLEKAAVIMDIFNAVYDMPKGDERIRMTTEIVAAIVIEELQKIGMAGNVPENERFLDVFSQVIGNTTVV